MEPISWILAVTLLLGSCQGKPQVDGSSLVPSVDPSTSLVSPWSQWMSLKAPPIPGLPMGGSKAKKKLIPGPAPPEGTPEAPWVSWTRMKVSSALTPTGASLPTAGPGALLSPLLSPPPPPSPINSDAGNDTSSTEPAIWIQWTQMKLPLTNPLTTPGSTPETPWDAWTNLKIPLTQPGIGSSASAGMVKRMAPDRYSSTVAPRLLSWSQEQSSQGQPMSSIPSSARPSYMSVFNITPPSPHYPDFDIQTPAAFGPLSGMPQFQRLSQVSPVSSPPVETLSTVLRPIPHQLVSQIVAKATPEELTQVILAVVKAEEQISTSSPTPTILVSQVLPSSLVAKLPDILTPLLATPIKPPTAATPLSLSSKAETGPIQIIPEPVRSAILATATPAELTEVITTLAKLEAIPPAEQTPLANVPVSAILPPSLEARIPPSVKASTTKLVPPILLTLPAPVVDAILPVATPPEVAVLVANTAKLAKIPSVAPRPSLGALLPPSLLAKVPSQVAPLLANPVPPPATVKTTTPSNLLLSSLPAPLAQEILAKATPSDVATVVNAISVLEATTSLTPLSSPPLVMSVVPPKLVSKLSPEVLPILSQPLALAPPSQPDAVATVLKAVPPPILQQIVAVATPDELAEIKESVEEKVPATKPVVTSILPLLPISLVNKLPPQSIPYLTQPVTIEVAPSVSALAVTPLTNVLPPATSPVVLALSKLPAPLISQILSEATPAEISEMAEVIAKLEAVPPAQKALLSEVNVKTILPPTLLAKVPATVLPLLEAPLVLSEAAPSPTALPPVAVAPHSPIPTIPGVPPTIVATIAPALSAAPPPLVQELLMLATSAELSEIVATIEKIETLPPAAVPKIPIVAILPASLIAKVPATELPLLTAPLTIPISPSPSLPVKVTPEEVPTVPPTIVAAVAPVLSALAPPVVKEVLTEATPAELVQLIETIKKLEALPPSEASIISKLEVETILPPTLVAKLPAPIVPLLAAPITLPPATPPPTLLTPEVPGVPPKIVAVAAPALSALPPPVIQEILTKATPAELVQLVVTIKKLEALPPAKVPLISKLEVETVLPPTLVAKLPPQIVPLLAAPLTIKPVTPAAVTLLTPEAVPTVPPEVVTFLAPVLSKVPLPAAKKVLTVATPEELAELIETVIKLEALPRKEAPLASKLEVQTILPASLVAKVPAPIIPLLAVPLTLPPVTPTPAVLTPSEVPAVPPTVVETVAPVLSALPPPVVKEVLTEATPSELVELVETIKKLEALPPVAAPLVSKLEVETILPSTLVAKLPAPIVPLLAAPITLPPAIPLSTVLTPAEVPAVPPKIVAAVAPVLSALPPPVVKEVLTKASPAELMKIVDIITKLEALPPTDAPLVAKLEVETILPTSLVAKLPAAMVPLLEAPITMPAMVPPAATPTSLIPTVPGVPPTIISEIAPALSLVPPPVVAEILSAATPEELKKIEETITKLLALPPSEAPLVAKLEVESILPPTLVTKLPPAVIPLLDVPITIPAVAPAGEVPPQTDALESIVSTLSAVPPPVVTTILTVATPAEIVELAETITKLEAVPPAEKPLIEKLEVKSILPSTLLAKLPPDVLPTLDVPVALAVPSATAPAVVAKIVPALAAVPPSLVPEILSLATPTELAEVAETIEKLENLPPAVKPIISALDIQAILPPTLVAKLPPSIIPMLAKPITLPGLIPEVTSPVPTEPVPLPEIPGLPPSIASIVLPPLSDLSAPAITKILTTATPSELAQMVDTIMKLEALPLAEKKLALTVPLQVGTVLPPSLVVKLPPSVVSLLGTPVKIPGVVSPPAVPVSELPTPMIPVLAPPEVVPPSPIIPGVPPSISSVIIPALSGLPPPVITSILTAATPDELAQVAETITELENLPASELSLLPAIPIASIIPSSVIARLPPGAAPLLAAKPVELVPPSPEATPVLPPVVPELALPFPVVDSDEKIPPAEQKVLVKWAKVILEKTGKPATAPVPGEIPPLQAAWMEWVQLKVNASKNTTVVTPVPKMSKDEATTEYPWTQWLKLKSNSSVTLTATPTVAAPLLDVTTESPEKEVLDWLEQLTKGTSASVLPPRVTPPPSPEVSPETEAMVEEALKELGIEIVDLPPDQIKAILVEVEKTITPSIMPAAMSPPAIPEMVPPPAIPGMVRPPVSPGMVFPEISGMIPPSANPGVVPPFAFPNAMPAGPLPYYPFWPPPSAYLTPPPQPPPESIFPPALPPTAPESPVLTPTAPESPVLTPNSPESPVFPTTVPEFPLISPSPTLNLTEYLISNSLIPAETSPLTTIPIPTLTKLISEQSLLSSSSKPPPSTITAAELSSLTPTKFAALLKQILKDCKVNTTTNSTLTTRSAYPNQYATYYKNKYSGMRGKRSPALYPIPSQAFLPTSTPSPAPLDSGSLPLPKIDTAGTVLDPAYWAAQKSMFLSKLFSTLAKVALNDTSVQASTPSPKDQLAKQVNAVLLSDMTRSVHHHPPKKQPPQILQQQEDEEDSSEYDYQQDDSGDGNDTQETPSGSSHDFNQDEKELVSNDNREPNLPREPENPLHKLFKFGVQKTVLSDLTTPSPPTYIYITPDPSYYSPVVPIAPPTPPVSIPSSPAMINYMNKQHQSKKKFKGKKKHKSASSNRHHHNSGKHTSQSAQAHRFRASTTTTTTENPVDFELLAKALLLDDTGNGPKGGESGRRK